MYYNSLFETMLSTIPKGFAYFNVIVKQDDDSIDFEALGMNEIFKSTFQIGNEVSHNNQSELLILNQEILLWLETDGNRLKVGNNHRFEHYFEKNEDWYSITIFVSEPNQFALLIDDITDIKKIELENKRLKDEYETIFNSTQVAMFLIDVVEESVFRFKRLNKSHEELTGLTTKMIIGKTPVEFLGNEVGSSVVNHYAECVNKKESITYEETLTLKTGTKTWLTTLSPICEKGKVIQLVGASKDITERKYEEIRIREEKKWIDTTLHSINDAVITTDLHGRIILMNHAAEVVLGIMSANAVGQLFDNIVNVQESGKTLLLSDFIHKLNQGELGIDNFETTILIDYHYITKNVIYKRVAIIGEEGCPLGIVVTLSDETTKIKTSEELKYISMHDRLTGLYNRAYFEEELQRIDVARQLPISFVIGDVNGLKISNDVFGHKEGDKLLISVAELLKNAFRNEDVIARWGGDEFCIILPQTSKIMAKKICSRIQKVCAMVDATPIRPSISFGTATKVSLDQKLEDVFNEAEESMYKNKLAESKANREYIMQSIMERLDKDSNETIQHCKRVKKLIVKSSDVLKLSNKDRENLLLLAEIHDIGNIGIQSELLKKPAKFTMDEMKEVERHAELGYRIAQSSAEFVSVAELILSHHEKWDGSGYPQGLHADEIPLLSRILAIFDTYDQLTHDRPYQKAVSTEAAISQIRMMSGTYFDPSILEPLLDNIQSKL